MRLHRAPVRVSAAVLIVLATLGGCRLFPPRQAPFDASRDLSAELPVFPGAEGFGTATPAGRGGTVYVVDTLAASGPGSLAEALTATGPRIVVFEVGGIIELANAIEITDPFLTVAGQTAPAPGITLVGSGIIVQTHDVLIQHLRVRPGDRADGRAPEDRDGIAVIGNRRGTVQVYNVVVDHCSVSWAIDEGTSTWYDGVSDVTFSNNLIAENLSESLHPEGEHSKGLLIGDHSRRISVIRNVFAHNTRRNPLLKGDTSTIVANNLIYNSGTSAIGFSDPEWSGRSIASIMGNVFVPGSDTSNAEHVWRGRETSDDIRIYLNDNLVDEASLAAFTPPADITEVEITVPPVDLTPLTLVAAADLETELIATAGAFPAERGSVDARIISAVQARGGSIIDSQSEVGGYPTFAPASRALTLPANPAADDDADGYTNMEEWIHSWSVAVEVP